MKTTWQTANFVFLPRGQVAITSQTPRNQMSTGCSDVFLSKKESLHPLYHPAKMVTPQIWLAFSNVISTDLIKEAKF